MVKKGREILEDKESGSRAEERGEESERPNSGKLILDATCAPADIKYPTDLDLLNQARQGTEKILDCLYREVKDKWLFGLCYAMDGDYKGWNPYIERHLAIFVNCFLSRAN